MTEQFIAKKLGMTQLFDEEKGLVIVCTVLTVPSNYISQVKTVEVDGYNALQIAAFPQKEQRAKKPLKGHFSKSGLQPFYHVTEFRVDSVEGFQAGQELSLEGVKEWKKVNVTGNTIGKGYQGVMKKYGFAGGPAAHGSGFHRHAGSTGMRSTPGRCFPGGPRASRMGNQRKTVAKLSVVKIDLEKKVLLVKGAVPGAIGSVVQICKAQ